MIRALALRLKGPMQSWGGPVAGNDRPSLDVPTKSGVIGLVAGALGVERTEVERLAQLHQAFALAVRIDKRGTVGVDYHTTLNVPTAEGNVRKDAVISKRRYIYDASFAALLVARDSAPPLEEIAHALRHPRFAPFLGRRACVPSGRVFDRGPIEGADWKALFDQVPVDSDQPDEAPHDVHLDEELAPGIVHRRRRQRDVLIGRLPRLFGERVVHVVAGGLPQGASTAKETIDPWMP